MVVGMRKGNQTGTTAYISPALRARIKAIDATEMSERPVFADGVSSQPPASKARARLREEGQSDRDESPEPRDPRSSTRPPSARKERPDKPAVVAEAPKVTPPIEEPLDPSITIFSAAQDGNVKAIRQLIAKNPSCVAETNFTGATPLHIAAAYGHADAIRALAPGRESWSAWAWKKLVSTKGFNVNAQNNAGNTALHLAAERNQPNVIVALYEIPGIQVNLSNSAGQTPLHIAAKNNAASAITELLKHKDTDPNAVIASSGNTPLHVAAEFNKIEAIDALCMHPGIEKDAQRPIDGETPLHLAIIKNHDDAVAALLRHNANPTIKTAYGSNAKELAEIAKDKLSETPDKVKNARIRLALKNK